MGRDAKLAATRSVEEEEVVRRWPLLRTGGRWRVRAGRQKVAHSVRARAVGALQVVPRPPDGQPGAGQTGAVGVGGWGLGQCAGRVELSLKLEMASPKTRWHESEPAGKRRALTGTVRRAAKDAVARERAASDDRLERLAQEAPKVVHAAVVEGVHLQAASQSINESANQSCARRRFEGVHLHAAREPELHRLRAALWEEF